MEAIFAKAKPELEKATTPTEDEPHIMHDFNDDDDDLDEEEIDDKFDDGNDDDDDDTFDEEKLTEESYRTTFEETPDELNLEAEDISEEEEY